MLDTVTNRMSVCRVAEARSTRRRYLSPSSARLRITGSGPVIQPPYRQARLVAQETEVVQVLFVRGFVFQ